MLLGLIFREAVCYVDASHEKAHVEHFLTKSAVACEVLDKSALTETTGASGTNDSISRYS